MCGKAVDDCLAALKHIADWFVTNKMLGKFHDAVIVNDYILFFDEDFSKVSFGKSKAHRKDLSKNLISITWHPTRWWDWCIQNLRKKK